MKNLKKAIWGIVLVAVAALMALKSFGIIDFEIFFDGWWTLFIIIPSLVGVIQERDKSGSIIGLLIGILLLLSAQDIIDFDFVLKLALPLLIAYIGFKMIFSSFKKNKADRVVHEIKIDGDRQSGVAVFCGTELNFDNAVFEGAELVAVFGGVYCNLKNAIIDRDCVIKACAVFGGIDIIVPDNVKVVTNATSIFGGIDVEKSNPVGEHTLYIEGVCMFGGIDVK